MMASASSDHAVATTRLVLVFSDHRPTGQAYIKSLCPSAGGRHIFRSEASVQFELLDAKTHETWWKEKLPSADAVIFLVRHLDKHSLDHIKTTCNHLASHKVSKSIIFCREKADREFKISCPDCSQKLWIGYNEINQKGRCPQCKFVFPLPQPEDLLKSELNISADLPLFKATLDDVDSCMDTVSGVMNSWTEQAKANTTRIQLCSEDSTPS